MRPRIHRFRLRRMLRLSVHDFADSLHGMGEFFERNFFSRLYKLPTIWRPVGGWILLFLLIIGCLITQTVNLRSSYQTFQPVPGGLYTEGIEGTFTTANPLYAVNDADTSVSRLIFASLLKYDSNNHLVGDLASDWSTNPEGTVYTVHLRKGLVWQDGAPLTSSDVLFTYHTIQDPTAQSPLQSSWVGVAVAAPNPSTITFTLPNPLSSFPYSLTNGIVPEHILKQVAPVDLRSASFNTVNPIGAGPFTWESLGVTGIGDTAEAQISLLPFKNYYGGKPKLTKFTLYAYASQGALLKAYTAKDVLAMLAPGEAQLPASVTKGSETYNLPLAAGVYVFFKTNQDVLKDVKVRQALVAAANRPAIISALGFTAVPVDEPLLHSQLGYDAAYKQQTAQLDQAKSLLQDDGWQADAHGMRSKNGQPLTFNLYAASGSEYATVAKLLVSQWRAAGVNAQLTLEQPDDLQGLLSAHAYDAVLDGIALGADPDVFVYWDSSQADVRSPNRLNFSEYSSKNADLALEAARTRLDPALRAAKYKTFLQAWQQDAPALALYQPRLQYIAHTSVYGLSESLVNTDADRFNNVNNWMIQEAWVSR